MHAVIGTKVEQTQKFLADGTRIPVTVVATPGNPVVMVKTKEKDGYTAVQIGLGTKKNPTKSLAGHVKKAQLEKAPSFLKEVRFTDKQAESLPQVGETIAVNTVLEAGDIVDVVGFSKGKGFAGGVKRYHFRGGPKTHGQSDRHRAPGSIGSGTTPGRVYKGKRMAGKMGNETVTLKNLEVVEVGTDFVWVRGLVPGAMGAVVTITATGKKNKKFVAVLKNTKDTQKVTENTEDKEAVSEEAAQEPVQEEVASAPEAEVAEAPKEEKVSSDAKAVEDKEEAK